jgi:phage baseplate assembly protein gpV
MPAALPRTDVVPKVDVAGKKMPGDLVGARVERALGLVGRAVLRFGPVPTDWAPTSAPVAFGDDVQVLVPAAVTGSAETLFKGAVTGIQLEQSRGIRELVVTADDAASKLTLGTRTTAYVGQGYADVIRAMAGRAGLSLQTSAPTETVNEKTYYLQSGTDLEFLQHASARTGCVWWVEPTGKLRWEPADVDDAVVELRINDGDSFSVRATGLKPDAVDVVGWDPAKQAEFVETTSTAAATAPTLAKGYPAASNGARKLVVRDASPLTPNEAKSLAASVAASAAGEAVQARGDLGYVPHLSPANSVKVGGTGVMDGTFRLSEVEHVYSRSAGLRVRFVAGPLRPTGLVDLLGGGAPRGGGGHLIEGVLPAVVTNVTDPSSQGRVKVRFSTQGQQVESSWARLVTIGAGSGRGLEFQPEVGDEVLVAFELGDVRRPVVLGGLYSDTNKLPTSPQAGNVADGKVGYRRITTRLGHVIELADGDSDTDKHVRLELGSKKHRIRLGEDKTEIVVDSKPVTITNGDATITFSAAGDVTIEGNNITLKAKQAVKVEGAQVEVKGQSTVKVEGAQVAVKGSAAAEVQGGATLTLKGGMVAIN